MSVLDIAMAVADGVSAMIPSAVPTRESLEKCRIISHRGEHDNKHVQENTLQAFQVAHDAGVWGIECDIRWTADLVPVICHDPSPLRVFAVDTPLAQLSFPELRSAVPQIPTLEELVEAFGNNTHLMLELKAEPWPDIPRQRQILERTLAALKPAQDYHFLSLQTAMFDHVAFAPGSARLPVAELNVTAMSDYALNNHCAGIGCHYLLLGAALHSRHSSAGQKLGIGFPASANCFKRQLNRGIEWIFSNDAVALEGLRQQLLADAV